MLSRQLRSSQNPSRGWSPNESRGVGIREGDGDDEVTGDEVAGDELTQAARTSQTAIRETPMTEIVPSPRAPKKPVIVWDVGVSIILMIVAAVIVAFLSLSAALLVFSSDSCGSESCNLVQLQAGWIGATIAPALTLIAGIVIAIVRMVRRRVSFWIPIVALVVAGVLWFVGVLLVFGSVPGFRP
jgi:magnesium-transporting ATPase (P-type)